MRNNGHERDCCRRIKYAYWQSVRLMELRACVHDSYEMSKSLWLLLVVACLI